MAGGKDTLVHCMQGKHRSGAFLCFIQAFICNDFQRRLDDYLKSDLLPRDRKYLTHIVFERDLHARLRSAHANPGCKRHVDTISEKVAHRGVEEVLARSPSDEVCPITLRCL